MYFSRKANGWDLETFIFIQYSRFSSSLIICYVVQALESMQEKGMQNDPRYPQLMAMANKAKQYAHMEGMASQDNMGGPPDRSRGKRPSF